MTEDTRDKLQMVLDAFPGTGRFRLSSGGSPHVVVRSEGGTIRVSVVWFSRDGNYRTFWPWPSYGAGQRKEDWGLDEFKLMVAHIKTVLNTEDKMEVAR